MGGAEQKRSWTLVRGAIVGLGIWVAAVPAVAQQAPGQVVTPGDQIFTFSIDQTFAANDNIRLDPESVGTTYYSDTTLGFGFASQTQQQQFNFDVSGVLRAVDDPVVGTDSDFRDPSASLFFSRTNRNDRLTAYANYDRPDLAFLDALTTTTISGQDVTRSAGEREDVRAGVTLETGLQSRLGLLIDVNTRNREYFNTTDPALFDNRTDSALIQGNVNFSPVSNGRIYASDSIYRAEDSVRTQTETRTVGIGVDRDLDAATVLSFDLGYSGVFTEERSNPGVDDTFEGYVGQLALIRQRPNGQFDVSLDSTLNRRGRQNTLQFGRDFILPTGAFGFSLGATTGDDFDVRPIGSLKYAYQANRTTFDVSATRTVQIDETLDQLTENSQFKLGYNVLITPQSSFDLQAIYANVAVVRSGSAGTNTGRDRLGVTASYIHDLAQSWQLRGGYAYREFRPQVGDASHSNEVFISFQKVFDIYR